MSFFDDILKKRNIPSWEPNMFLWELRINDEEYALLKDILREAANKASFRGVSREATLYYAEWWRREYEGGHVGIEDVCESLTCCSVLKDDLYQAAKDGQASLGFKSIRTKGETRERNNDMYSIYYQGGLPMNSIIKEIQVKRSQSSWDRFFRKLVWKLHDFTEVSEKLGTKTLALSDSVQAFSETLRVAADCLSPAMQPYIHQEEWWNIIIRNFEEEKRKRKAKTPFESTWFFGLDDIGKQISVGFKFSGPRTLSQEFIKEHNLENRSFTTFSVLVNNTSVFTAEYDGRFYCSRNVEKSINCNLGDTISVVINETGTVLSSREINFDIPKVIYLIDHAKNIYRLGDAPQLKEEECRIISTCDWDCCYNYELYNIGATRYKVFTPAKGDQTVKLISAVKDQVKTLKTTSDSLKTFIDWKSEWKPEIRTKERLFNLDFKEDKEKKDKTKEVVFYEGYNENEINTSRPVAVVYAEKGSDAWISRAKLGEIKAKVQRKDKESVEFVSFINSGNLSISLVSSSRDICEIHISWKDNTGTPYGNITSSDAIYSNGNWIIEKSNLSNHRFAEFQFHPNSGLGSTFTLNLLPLFYGFGIYDRNNNRLLPNSIIPMTDIGNFRYYLRHSKNVHLSPHGAQGELKYKYSENGNDNDVFEYLCEKPVRKSKVNFEDRLASIFMDGSAHIHRLLNLSCKSLPFADVKIDIKTENGTETYTLKEFPYRLKYESDETGEMVIVKNVSTLPRYDEDLLAIPIDCPNFTPIVLQQSTVRKNCYFLPSSITQSDYTKWLVYGKLRGYILPFAIDVTQDLTPDTRDDLRANTIKSLKGEFLNAPISDPIWNRAIQWYNRLPLGRIPGTSILDLVAISDDNMLIKKFALHLWLDALYKKESLETLKASLIEFSEQMSFLWSWSSKSSIIDYVSGLFKSNSTLFEQLFYTWVLSIEDQRRQLELLSSPTSKSPTTLIEGFEDWFEDLVIQGHPEAKYDFPDEFDENSLSKDAKNEFEFWRNFFKIPEHPTKIAWIQVRYKISEMLSGTLNFGETDYNEKTNCEIRKSIISGLSYKNQNDEL